MFSFPEWQDKLDVSPVMARRTSRLFKSTGAASPVRFGGHFLTAISSARAAVPGPSAWERGKSGTRQPDVADAGIGRLECCRAPWRGVREAQFARSI